MADTDGTERSSARRSLNTTTSNNPEVSSHVPPSQDEQTSLIQIWNKHADPTPLDSFPFDRHQWAERNIHILSSTAGTAPNRGILFENLSIQGSASSDQVHPTVLSAFIRPAVSVVKLFYRQSHEQQINIVHNLDGLICNGELLLVLGRPGSGCSTFLKAICGYLDGLVLDPASRIQYTGLPIARMIKDYRGQIAYNQEEDHHFPHLTVGQTLEFAAYARTPHTRLGDMDRDGYAKKMVQVAMTLFELSHTQDTQVGNEYIRGVSGGERKRVSIAEMALARASIGAWDNSTRGLDATRALNFVQALRLSANLTNACHAAALSQASEPMYNTFDIVTVLYEGRQVYFGPCQHAVAYFEKMGWKRPTRQVSADFLTSVTNPSAREPQAGMEERVPRSSQDFETYWKQSPEYIELQEKMKNYSQSFPVDSPEESKVHHTSHTEQADHIRLPGPFPLSTTMQLRLCLIRACRRTINDRAGIIATAVVQIVIAVLIGSLFYNIPDASAGLSQRASVIFLAVLTNNLIALLEINVLYSQRPVVEKHARYAFVRPFTEALAGAIIDLPIKLLRCLLASVIIYFMANLRREAGHFFIYLLFQLVSVIAMSGFFRCLATITKTISQAMALGGITIICIAVYTGFTIPQPDMRPWLSWIRWLNPIFYTFEAVIANEFHGLRAKCVNYLPDYPSLSGSSFTCLETGAVAGEHYVSGDRHIEKHYDYSYSHLWRNCGILIVFLVSFHVLYLVLAELVPGTVSAPKTLSFLPGYIAGNLSPPDEETGQQPKVSKELSTSNSQSCRLLPNQEKILTWQGLCYDVPVKGGTKRLLDDVSGWVKPGTLTALMGMSGAGKTTLLDVLSQRATLGVVTGEMLVNGTALNTSICRKTGYVEQNDLHCETATIREALRFSAALRQPRSVSMEEKYAFVEEVIQMLGMEDFAEAIVGNTGEGLNIEQRKLLTIGVELAAKPELLIFLDEPTSGLESQSSLAICSFMRKLVDHGQAVLATIHQPNAVMFEQFDRLMLLGKGGRTVYFGDIGSHSRTILDYVETNGARPCGPAENPAEYILEVVSEDSQDSSQSIDWVDIWKQSPQNQEVLNHLCQISSTPSQGLIIDTQSEPEFAMPITAQLYLVMKRDFQQYYRQPDYIIAKLALGIVCGLFIGFSFWMSDNSNQGFQNTMFSLFLLCTIFSTMINQIMPKFIGRRTLYELRERPSKTYSWKVFIFSQIVVELPWQALLGICTWASFYFSVYGEKQDAQQQGLVLLFVLQFFLFASSFASLIASAVPSPVLGSMIGLFMFVLSLLSNGVMQPPGALPPFWSYMHRVSPLTYYVGGISATALHGRPIHCSDRETVSFDAPAGQSCGEYLGKYMAKAPGNLYNWTSTGKCHYCPLRSADQYLASREIFWTNRWRDYGILWAYFAVNIFGAVLLYYLFRVLPYSRSNKVKKRAS
ncbi:hypothetical protein N7447_004337 [Penicillium robsamsonii]|uniref:uncharacterized protein n=1 Tax=Penicillium robsamsonii TaxID=1792511 RepID=UPI0025492BAB|nr:uncharacterized protein N7447_004337 [Penicillium robsamsonii]KAJ5827574.1 hypothetical protein N7447_004337 [Penicillium robsamsonii]